MLEIEIKISKSDLRRDRKKNKWRMHTFWKDPFRERYFAVPTVLTETALAEIPSFCGVLSVDEFGRVSKIRKSTINSTALPLDDKGKAKIGRLAALRLWK